FRSRNDKAAVEPLQQLATSAPDFRTRVQAVWTLAGMGSLDADSVKKALEDSDPYVRNAGLRGAEQYLAKGDAAMLAAVMKKADDSNWQDRRQLTASLGALPPNMRLAPVVAMMKKYGDDHITVDAGVSSLKGQEADALTELVAQSGTIDAAQMLAGAAAKSRNESQ